MSEMDINSIPKFRKKGEVYFQAFLPVFFLVPVFWSPFSPLPRIFSAAPSEDSAQQASAAKQEHRLFRDQYSTYCIDLWYLCERLVILFYIRFKTQMASP